MGNNPSKTATETTIGLFLSGHACLLTDADWDQIFRTPLSNETLQSCLPFELIRKARKAKSSNLIIFFLKVLRALRYVINLGLTDELNAEAAQVAVTCVSLLTRVIPVLLEVSADHQRFLNTATEGDEVEEMSAETEFVYSLFWGAAGMQEEQQLDRLPPNVNTSAVASNGVETTSPKTAFLSYEEIGPSAPLAVRILSTLQELLFLKNFTVLAPGLVFPENYVPPKHKVNTRLLWKGGVGSVKETPSFGNNAIYANRRAVLKCLLVCLSSPLYMSGEEYRVATPSLWLWTYTRGFLPYTANLYCSLMSTVFSYNPATGFGLGYGKLGFFRKGEEPLADIALQLLCVVFGFDVASGNEDESSNRDSHHNAVTSDRPDETPPPQRLSNPPEPSVPSSEHNNHIIQPENGREESQSRKSNFRNVFRLMLASMKRDYEIDMVFNSLVRLLKSSRVSRSYFLYSQASSGECYQELLLVLWHLITVNSTFLNRITTHLNSNELLVPLLVLMLDASTKLREETSLESSSQRQISTETSRSAEFSRGGLIHLCTFILLILSEERQFAVRLNEPFNDTFPLPLCPFRGCYADLLIIVFYQLIIDQSGHTVNVSLIDILSTTICNITAYIKSLCLESCVRLMTLVKRLSRPSWLFRDPYQYRDLFLLLEALNNIIQYQYEGNTQLIYSILRQSEVFEQLDALTFPKERVNLSSAVLESSDSEKPKECEDTNGVVDTQAAAEDKSLSSAQETSIKEQQDASKWQPTEEWFNDWKSKAPLLTILRLIDTLLPQVTEVCQTQDLSSPQEVLEFLRHTTMVGILPLPHPILIRSYLPHPDTHFWFTLFMWGVIVSRLYNLFDPQAIRLLQLP